MENREKEEEGEGEERGATAEELLRKIQKLEEDHARLKHSIISMSNSISNLINNNNNNNDNNNISAAVEESKYVNMLQSMGQSMHMFDLNYRIIYWNQMAENLYGYTAAEALGKTAPEVTISPADSEIATVIIQRVVKEGETWSGQFPVRNKRGDKFFVVTTLAPCLDDKGNTFGVTCVCADARHFLPPPLIHHPPPQTTITSKISTLASKVKTRIMDHDTCDVSLEAWMMGKKGISWPWKGRPCWPNWLQLNHHHEEPPLQGETPCTSSSIKQAPGSYSCATSSSSSINSETDAHSENLDVEIAWDDLIIRNQIGQGSRGTVYHALLYGSDVAVKIYNKQQYPDDDVLLSFRKEVCLMKRLRYPNILLFMGAVVSPQHLCIVTEFLPCGSLFKLLQRSRIKLDWRRRVHMAIDIAQGMNYLHSCQPPIVHRNLNSSNLLVDKNWTLKVGDFGLSRIKHEAYLQTNTRTGMPNWMAPEVLRNERVDEKCDLYSYGVVLWEITTGKIPWENLNSMQVIGAVGFMDRRLQIPNDVHPLWASLIQSCWSREPQSRPTFQEVLIKLKVLQKNL